MCAAARDLRPGAVVGRWAGLRVRARYPLIFRDQPKSAAAEAYRSLRTSVHFLPPEKQGAIVVTSGAKGEGKTACVANLGVALASAGRRVLLVNADMRKPGLDRVFGGSQTTGLSRLLSNTATMESAVLPTGVPCLDFVPCGPVPPNPAELLGLPLLATCLERWQDKYDHVILDTPPLLGVTDALLLARLVGRALVVVRAMRTTDRALGSCMQQLRDVGVDVLGVVLVGHRSPADAAGYGGAYAVPYGMPVTPGVGPGQVPGPLLGSGPMVGPALGPGIEPGGATESTRG